MIDPAVSDEIWCRGHDAGFEAAIHFVANSIDYDGDDVVKNKLIDLVREMKKFKENTL